MTAAPASFDMVTGAFGYIGRYTALELLARGRTVRTFTRRSGEGTPLEGRVRVLPQRFDDRAFLERELEGCDVLYNTYWIRFPRGGQTYEQAIERSRNLFAAAGAAGVRRIVHVSVTNCRLDSELPYYAGKARLEDLLRQTGISYAIVRPTLVFGVEDILVNNIAWMLRRFPFVPIPGAGDYRVQPIYVGDLARLLVEAGEDMGGRRPAAEGDPPAKPASDTGVAPGEADTFDAAGPDTMSYREMLELIRDRLGLHTPLVRWPPWLALLGSRVTGLLVRDVVLTKNELRGLMDELLVSNEPPRGTTRLADWLERVADRVGDHYTSELARHFRGLSNGGA
ncbi:MAG TPA: NAD(P)H-binding protein [Acidobacteriota bacterium]